MDENINSADFVIVGAGILGLTVALRLHEAFPQATISIIEKEKTVGVHASGRNSGVVHSGIYYPPSSLKAQLCTEGAQLLREYCLEHKLPLNPIGKVIVPTTINDTPTLELLYQRGLVNGIRVELLDTKQLHELEPATKSLTGQALFVPDTAVVDSKAILNHLFAKLKNVGICFYFGQACQSINSAKRCLKLDTQTLHYGHLINTAGLYADKIAEMCGIKQRYTMLPFKGLYYEVQPEAMLKLQRLIYPVPDMNVPFLGVHFTQSITQKIYVGPSAIPAFGREQYRGLQGFKWQESTDILFHLLQQYKLNHNGFRAYAHHEAGRFLKANFIKAAKLLIPSIKSEDLKLSNKVGIRAQLLDLKSRTLVMDFLTEKTAHETHILNAVSPAFTSALSFSKHVAEQIN